MARTTIKGAIARLSRLKAGMERPQDFYRLHQANWEELARNTARQVFLANRPPEVDVDEWMRTTEQAARMVGSQLFSLDAVGVLIFLEARRGRDMLDELATGGLTLADITDYVAAGRAGDPLGKPDFDERDRVKSDEQVAMNIYRAIQEGKTDRGESIEAFLAERLGDRFKSLLPTVLATWREVFAVRAATDWRRFWRRAIHRRG